MSLDEYYQEPYYCDDCDTWHMNLYDVDDDGTIYQGDQDGNWDSTVDSLPTFEELDKAWNEYTEWVISTGKDPLDQFTHGETVTKTEKWRFGLADSLLGIMVIRASHNHHPVYYSGQSVELPEHVADYLNLKRDSLGRYILQELAHIPDLELAILDSKKDKLFKAGGKVTLHSLIEHRIRMCLQSGILRNLLERH